MPNSLGQCKSKLRDRSWSTCRNLTEIATAQEFELKAADINSTLLICGMEITI